MSNRYSYSKNFTEEGNKILRRIAVLRDARRRSRIKYLDCDVKIDALKHLKEEHRIRFVRVHNPIKTPNEIRKRKRI